MKKISAEELQQIVADHQTWLAFDRRRGRKADLSGTDLSGVELPEARLEMANLAGANLSGANLLLSDLSQADLTGADLSGADLSGADLLLVLLPGADLSGADLSVADLSGGNLAGARLAAALLPQADLSGVDFSGADLSGADFSGANLSGASLRNVNLSQARLHNADLSRADLYGAKLLLTALDGATLREANLSDVLIDGLTLEQIADEVSAQVRRTFQVIDMACSGREYLVREVSLPPHGIQAAMVLLGFFAAFLVEKQSLGGIVPRISLKGTKVTLTLRTSDSRIRDQIEELLRVYAQILRKQLLPEAFSNDGIAVQRLERILERAETFLEEDGRLLSGQKDADAGWLREQVGQALERQERGLEETPCVCSQPVAIPSSSGMQPVQGMIKRMIAQAGNVRAELAVLFQQLSEGAPEPEDIQRAEQSLAAIRRKAPDIFDTLIHALADAGKTPGGSVWGDVLPPMIHRLKQV